MPVIAKALPVFSRNLLQAWNARGKARRKEGQLILPQRQNAIVCVSLIINNTYSIIRGSKMKQRSQRG